MIVKNLDRESVLGIAIEVAGNSASRAKGLLGRESLAEGEGLLFTHCSSLHTFFMRFAIDIVFMDRERRVLKSAKAVPPFRLVAAPLRAHYALELPAGAIGESATREGDRLLFEEIEAVLGLAS